MSEMVERVAKALFNELRSRRGIKHAVLRHEGLDREADFEDNREWLMEVASTLIRAIREPTSSMAQAGYWAQAGLPCWRAMIDKALK